MGTSRFERQPAVPNSNKNVIEFDSSPERAIGRAHGWDPETVTLTEVSRTKEQINFDVHAAEYSFEGEPPKKSVRRGILKVLTREEIRLRNSGGVHFGVSFQ